MAVAVLIASRAEDTVAGLQMAYYVLGGTVIAAAVFVPWIPEVRRSPRAGAGRGPGGREAGGDREAAG